MRCLTTLILSLAAVLLIPIVAGSGASYAAERPPRVHYASSASFLGPISVEITNEGFVPAELMVPPHTTVTWVNRGATSHTVTGEAGRPDSPTLEPRAVYSYTFHNEGVFPYVDTLNPGLSGEISVLEGAALPIPTALPAPPTATPSAPTAVAPTPTAAIVPETQPTASPPPPAPISDSPPNHGPGLAAAGPEPSPIEQITRTAASTTNIDASNEWFGNASFQGGVYEVTVQTGDTVTWTVVDGVHNVFECGDNFANAMSCGGANFSSDVLTVGGSFSHTFSSAGSYYYLCTIHPVTMRGKVTVEGGAPLRTDEPPGTDVPADTNSGGGNQAAESSPSAAAGPQANTLVNAGRTADFEGGLPLKSIIGAAALAVLGMALISSAVAVRRWRM